MTPAAITAAALSLVGAPYRHQGRDAKTGVDCIGLAVVVMRRLGIPVRDVTNYRRNDASGALARLVAEQCAQATGPAEGVIVLIRWNVEAQHVGILVPGASHPLDMVHAWNGHDRVVRQGFDSAWRRRTVAWHGFAGVDYPPGLIRGLAREGCCPECIADGGRCS